MRDPKMMKAAMARFKRPAVKDEAEPVDDMGEEQAEEGDGLPLDDPRSASRDGETLYIDSDLFPGDCKVGERVKIVGTVTSLGTKFGVTPEEVLPYSENEGE